MIKGLTGQRESPGPSTRDYGCFTYTAAAIAQGIAKRVLTPDEILEIILRAIKPQADGLGPIIENNKIPVGEPGWKRIWVTDYIRLVKAFARAMGKEVRVDIISWKDKGIVLPTAGTNYVIGCFRTWTRSIDKEGNTEMLKGTHFALLEYNWAKEAWVVVYDPWPELKRAELIETRLLRVEEVA